MQHYDTWKIIMEDSYYEEIVTYVICDKNHRLSWILKRKHRRWHVKTHTKNPINMQTTALNEETFPKSLKQHQLNKKQI